MADNDIAIKVEGLSKYYKLGVINNGTLFRDIQSWWARVRGKEDPHAKIGSKYDPTKEGFWALKDLNFEIKKGDRVGIIGHNGAGKSTLLKLLSQITAPTEGSIKINGKIASLLEVGTGFHPEMTGRENIYMNGAILGMSHDEIDKKVNDIIEFSEIGEHIDTPVKRYSSGMYVRLAFAVAAHLDSDILIADEVLAVGDAAFQKKALGKMNELSTGEGRTVLFVSHNMAQVKQLCNKGILLSNGLVVQQNDNINDTVAAYLGVNEDKASLENTIWVNDGSFKNDNFCLKRMEIIDLNGNPVVQALEYGKKYLLRMTVYCVQNTLSIRFNIGFYKNTELLFSIGIPDDSHFNAGTYVIDFPIDTNLFYEGTYIAVPCGSIPNKAWIVQPCSFDMSVRFNVKMNDKNGLCVQIKAK